MTPGHESFASGVTPGTNNQGPRPGVTPGHELFASGVTPGTNKMKSKGVTRFHGDPINSQIYFSYKGSNDVEEIVPPDISEEVIDYACSQRRY